MKKISISILFLLVILTSFTSCHKSDRFKIKSDAERIDIKIKRFDTAIINLDTTNLQSQIRKLYSQFPEFMHIYTSEILNENINDTILVTNLFHDFIVNPTFIPVNKKALETFENIDDIEKSVSDAFTNIHFYFHDLKFPEIYFFVSGFNRSIILNDKVIGIGTDMYLGSNYKPYMDMTYHYMTYTMRRECISTDLVSAFLFSKFPMNSEEERLLDNMLYRGKVMYLLSVMMPNEKPEDLMGYKKTQWDWCLKYEKGIWATLIDQKDLFSTDMQLIRKYVNDAPFTAPVSQESPGRLGTWIGWQIVESYMNNNRKVTLQQLMSDNNYQKMLENSGYRPE